MKITIDIPRDIYEFLLKRKAQTGAPIVYSIRRALELWKSRLENPTERKEVRDERG
jgi:hypothetical protein